MDVGTLKAGTLVQLTGGLGKITHGGLARRQKVAFTTKAESIRIWSYISMRSQAASPALRPVTDPRWPCPCTQSSRPMAANSRTPLRGSGREGGNCGPKI